VETEKSTLVDPAAVSVIGNLIAKKEHASLVFSKGMASKSTSVPLETFKQRTETFSSLASQVRLDAVAVVS